VAITLGDIAAPAPEEPRRGRRRPKDNVMIGQGRETL